MARKPVKKETRGRKPTPESVRYMSLKRKGQKIGAIQPLDIYSFWR